MLTKKTLPLHAQHLSNGAKLVSFGDWEVPVYFTSILDEHQQVRTKVGIFDISHMGELRVEGAQSIDFLQSVLTNNVQKIKVGQTLYSPVCNEKGGILDDVIIYRFSDEKWMVIVNASNVDKVFSWFKQQVKNFPKVIVTNPSEARGIFAVQGPLAREIGKKMFGGSVDALGHHEFTTVRFEGSEVIYSTTGYTGEAGFELFFDKNISLSLWNQLFEIGKSFDLKPIGFGARDTLRLEAGCLLYGNDMDESVTPLEAALAWTVDLSKACFFGKSAISEQKTKGVEHQLVGFEMQDRSVARHGYSVASQGKAIGVVTSGVFAPSLQKSIGLARVESKYAILGNQLSILIRDQAHAAKIVKFPFYKSPSLEKLRKGTK